MRKVCDTEHGIIVRGARILATLAPFADELAVYPARPMPEGGDKFAVSFCIPMETPGLKFLCRDSVAGTDNVFDHPLSSRFDEQDAFLIFDDVEVPRDRLFIDANVKVYNQTNTRSWHSNVMQQTMIRAATKLEFAWGLATALAEAINDKKAPPRNKCWGSCGVTRNSRSFGDQAAEDQLKTNGATACGFLMGRR